MTDVGICATAYALPAQRLTLEDVFAAEGVALTPAVAARLGVAQVPACTTESGSALALAAAREALARAEVLPKAVDVIIDYSILPQEYLVPAWNMSNKLQHELDATRAFTLGFSGGGATNALLALQTAVALIQSDEAIHTALLVGADVALPGNRVLNPDDPVAVLGDGASALVVQGGYGTNRVLATALISDGALHDVCYIPGGALAYPNRPDLYRLQLDKARYDAAPRTATLQRLARQALGDAGLDAADVAHTLCPNVSRADQDDYREALGQACAAACAGNLEQQGHLQGTDLVMNLHTLAAAGHLSEGDRILVGSHGMGFLAGVTLLQR